MSSSNLPWQHDTRHQGGYICGTLQKQLTKPTPKFILSLIIFSLSVPGINLRKVENKKGDDKGTGGTSDVASILARRVAVEMSDSDNGGHSDSE